MRDRLLASGIAFLVVGIGFYMVAITQLPEYETVFGLAAMAFDSDLRQKYEFLKLLKILGPMAAAAGLIMSIAGIVSSNEG